MKTIFSGALVLALAAALIGGATFAYFSDSASSTNNSFSAGTLDIQASNDNSTFTDAPVTATWTSPTNWAPGQEFEKTVYIKNTGTLPVKYLAVDWFYQPTTGDDLDLAKHIQVTGLKEFIPTDSSSGWAGDWIDDLAAPQLYQNAVENYDNTLTLLELMQSYYGDEPSSGPLTDQFGGHVKHIADAITGDGYDVVPKGTNAIAPGGTYQMKMKFQFMPDTLNDFQGKSLTWGVRFMAIQDLSQDFASATP